MSYCSRFALTILALILAASAQAAPTEDKIRKLSSDPVWLYLLGIENFTPAATRAKSSIRSDNFFLAEQGGSDPYAELQATLQAFRDSEQMADGSPAQCYFRGRFFWLEQKLDLSGYGIRKVECPNYESWALSNNASISLVFASGYFKNPASYYGHILLKLNSPEGDRGSLNDNSVNFGANVPRGENMILYITKGLFGGYKGKFSYAPFYKNTQIYIEQDYRDVWEYPLNISDEHKKIVLGHLWELLKADYTYYFLKRNCVYRVAELLNILGDEDLTKTAKPWFVPQELIQKSYQSGLFAGKDVQYIPSRQSKMYASFDALSGETKNLVTEFKGDAKVLQSAEYASLPTPDKYRLVDFLLDYYSFLSNPDTKEQYEEPQRAALLERFKLPSQKRLDKQPPKPSPHLGRPPSYIWLTHDQLNNGSNRVRLGIRPAYYDQLDASFGHTKNSALTMGQLELGIMDQDLYISSFDLIHILSNQPGATGLPGDKKISWTLRVGAAQKDLSCSDCLASEVYAGVGSSSYLFGTSLVQSLMFNVGSNGEQLDTASLYLSPKYSIQGPAGGDVSFLLEAEHRAFLAKGDGKDIFRLSFRKPISNTFDVRLSAAHIEETVLSVSFGAYW